MDCTTKDVGNASVGVEDGWTKGERIVERGRGRLLGVQQMKHVLSSLLKVGISGEGGKGDLLWEEVHLEDVTFGHGVGEVTFPAPVVFGRRADVPADLPVSAEWSAGVGGGVGHDLGAGRGEGSAVEVELAEEGGMC